MSTTIDDGLSPKSLQNVVDKMILYNVAVKNTVLQLKYCYIVIDVRCVEVCQGSITLLWKNNFVNINK